MKKFLYFIFLLVFHLSFSQKEDQRIATISHQLEILSTENSGLTEKFKTEIQVSNITLSNFLIALAEVHKVNFNVSPELNKINIANNFSNVVVSDLLVFLCKEYNLTIDFTGNIMSIKPYSEPTKIIEERIIPISYIPNTNLISIDIKNDKLYDVFKRVMDVTGKNLVFTPGLENKSLTTYIQQMPFDAAMDKMALGNNLFVVKTKDDFYVFEDNTPNALTNTINSATSQRPIRRRNSNFFFKVLDSETKLLEVDFVNTSISDIINDIGDELKIDIFTASPLDNAGVASLRSKSITFDDLLVKLFETQISNTQNIVNANGQTKNFTDNNSPEKFVFKKDGTLYFFGTEKQLSVRKVEVIPLQFRSIELLSDPQGSGTISSRNFNSQSNSNYNNQYDNFNSNRNQNSPNQFPNQSNPSRTCLLYTSPSPRD